MVLKFEEYIKEGFINKTLKRVRTGEERIENRKPPLEEVVEMMKEICKSSFPTLKDLEIRVSDATDVLNFKNKTEARFITITFGRYVVPFSIGLNNDDSVDDIALEMCKNIEGALDRYGRETRTKHLEVLGKLLEELPKRYNIDYHRGM